jgi:hypothetical protein
MREGICIKGYPKQFIEETLENNNGYPVYRRRDDGRKVTANISSDRAVDLGNRYVVPYNPWLLLKYDAHINVEIYSSVKK